MQVSESTALERLEVSRINEKELISKLLQVGSRFTMSPDFAFAISTFVAIMDGIISNSRNKLSRDIEQVN